MFLRGISMKKLMEILRLHYDCKLSDRKIEKSTGASRKTVGLYISKFKTSGLSWPLPLEYQNEDKLSESC